MQVPPEVRRAARLKRSQALNSVTTVLRDWRGYSHSGARKAARSVVRKCENAVTRD